jgi:hypothetical protein
MKYSCGTEVILGDEIMVSSGPEQESLSRVVAIGLDLATEDIDRKFYDWAKEEGIITDTSIVIEWIDENPLAHNDPNYAPVGGCPEFCVNGFGVNPATSVRRTG